MSSESKVSAMVKALNGLEDDLDSLNTSVADMKRQMGIQTQKEIDSLYKKVRELANAEAEGIIDKARVGAQKEADRISGEAGSRLKEINSSIDGGFEGAVEETVRTIMEPDSE